MIYSLGDVSGAHFNPAVTLAIRVSKFRPADLTDRMTGLYMVAQILGGIVAGAVYKLIHNGNAFGLGPQPGFQWSQVAVAETIFTFVLCFVVLGTACAPK